ncbi:MAG TPA: hypothetical protein VIU61_06690, partial [Kofleriaceae bacterium]
MRQWAIILVVGGLGGCSLIYNPSNLPPPSDAPIDMKLVLDADPAMLTIERVTPELLLEGQGDGGSRKAVVVIHGKHIVAGATVTITRHGGGAANLVADPAQIAEDGNMIAVPVSVMVDDALDAGQLVELDITVMQPVPGAGMVTQVIGDDEPVALKIKGYGELNGAAVSLGTGVHEYSRITVTGGITTTNDNPALPLVVRAIAGASVMGTSSVSATNRTGVATGGSGGAGGTLTTAAGSGEGLGGGMPSGGGGSYGTKGAGTSPPAYGNPAIPDFNAGVNRSSGGAGGNINVTNGGAGGGGGGTIEISAGGTLVVGTITAKGGPGANGGSKGGGGSGGTVLLRSGVSVAVTSIDVAGGMATDSNSGGLGLIRIDAPGTLPAQTTPAYYRGPTLVFDTPLVTTEERPALTVRGKALTDFTYYFAKADGTDMRGPHMD